MARTKQEALPNAYVEPEVLDDYGQFVADVLRQMEQVKELVVEIANIESDDEGEEAFRAATKVTEYLAMVKGHQLARLRAGKRNVVKKITQPPV